MRLRGRHAALVLGTCLLIGIAAPAAASGPRVDPAYHTPPEVTAELKALQAAHPQLVRITRIGSSVHGRPIWMAKVSDHPGVDENEPEVFINARIHAREHLSTEQALAMLHWLTDGYPDDPRIRAIVDSTEVLVVPDANPDGAAYDLRGKRYQGWRKNRQRNRGTTAIGTDLNRNFGYQWGCCGGSSSNPQAITYRGPRAFSTPEARVLRDLVRSRNFGGVQHITLAMSFHAFGQQVLWPYGYTAQDVPADMTNRQHSILVALARGIARRNDYRAMQESSLYITSGTFLDWSFGVQHIPTFTMELAPTSQLAGGFYPPGSQIGKLTERNRDALLWFLAQAGDPGAAVSADDPSVQPMADLAARGERSGLE